ncbi:hypothetical protein [Bradyrhizobium algeriense]|uniref:hypothetical protein n=1 Tax=Bradyrhizobium algeriense TaxID=634784 RepID=UPI00167E8E1E|nr:hypothetical protein [Bradyrhizobium algeriense]
MFFGHELSPNTKSRPDWQPPAPDGIKWATLVSAEAHGINSVLSASGFHVLLAAEPLRMQRRNPSRGRDVKTTRFDYAAHSGACCRWVAFHRGVSQPDDTYEALVSTNDRQPPDLYIAHHWANWRLPKWFQSKWWRLREQAKLRTPFSLSAMHGCC